jgi:hypothetical protein
MDVLLVFYDVKTKDRIMAFKSPTVPPIGTTVMLYNAVTEDESCYCINRFQFIVNSNVYSTDLSHIDVYVQKQGCV